MSSYIIIIIIMSSLLSLEEVLSDWEDADNFIIINESVRRAALLSYLGDNAALVDAVIYSIHKVSLHSNNSCICNYA